MLFFFVLFSYSPDWKSSGELVSFLRACRTERLTSPPRSTRGHSGLWNVNRETSRSLLKRIVSPLQCLVGATSTTTNPGHRALHGHWEPLFSPDDWPSPGRLFRPFPSRTSSPLCAIRGQLKRTTEKEYFPRSGTSYTGSSVHNH